MTNLRDMTEQLRTGQTIIGDGAMATLLHQHGVPVRACHEQLNLTQPHLVADVHRAYVQAGSNLIQTNTFSAHRAGLERYGLAGDLVAINRAGVRIAKEAAGGQAYVFGSIGSAAGLRAPSVTSEAELTRVAAYEFEQQTSALLDEGVDGLLLETFAELGEMLLALQVVRRLTKLPILANLSPIAVGVTQDGVSIETAFQRMVDAGATMVGLNCALGPAGILRTYEDLPMVKEVSYAAVPNAGLLHVVDGDYSYTGSSDYFADTSDTLWRLGVRILGGCCGTTPEHIRKMADRIQALQANAETAVTRVEDESPEKDVIGHATANDVLVHVRSRGDVNASNRSEETGRDGNKTFNLLAQVARQTTVIVELDPPKSLDISKYLAGASALRVAGADMITLADNSLGSVRVSNMALASVLKGMDIEPLVHVTCRDRNLIGQQSHLMGLSVLDIHHILLVTGDPSRFGDLPGATSVYDVSSTELTRMVKRLNGGTAFSGQPLRVPSRFVVGTSFNPNVLHFDKAVDRLKRKIEAGADYVMTQPVFNPAMMERIAVVAETVDVPIFMGIMPLTSDRNAQFLHNEVPGIQIPEQILGRMSDAPPEHAAEVGLKIARELIDEALQYFHGIYLVTPFLRYELSVALVTYIRELTASSDEALARGSIETA